MRARILTATAAVTLIAAACGNPAETAQPVGSGDVGAMELAYAYHPGEDISYRFTASIDMTADMSGAGADLMGGPMVARMDISGTGDFSVADGSEPGTRAITASFDFDELEVRELTIGGEDMSDDVALAGLGDLASADTYFPEVTVVVDEHGNVLSIGVDGTDLPVEMLGGDLMGGFGDLMGPTSLFGPAFPEGELTVGSEWSSEDGYETPFFGPTHVTSDFRVTRGVVIEGHSMFLIESTTHMARVDVDLMEAFGQMAADDAGAMTALIPSDFGMQITIETSPIRSATWFDATAGLVTDSTTEMHMDMSMRIEMPGQGNQSVDMSMDATVGLEYLSRSSAA